MLAGFALEDPPRDTADGFSLHHAAVVPEPPHETLTDALADAEAAYVRGGDVLTAVENDVTAV